MGKKQRPPIALPSTPQHIPKALRKYPHWLNWTYKWDPEKEKWQKPPRNGTSTDANMTFNQAYEKALTSDGSLGIGINLQGGKFIGIDLDDVLNKKGRIKKKYKGKINGLLGKTYTEISPSGRGLRIIARKDKQTPTIGGRKGGWLEIYHRGRYLTITGDHFNKIDTISKADKEIKKLIKAAKGDAKKAKLRQGDSSSQKIDQLRALINQLPHEYIDDRDHWIKVGMILHYETEGSMEGAKLWDVWSRLSEKYREEECYEKWHGFGKKPAEESLKLGTLITMIEESKVEFGADEEKEEITIKDFEAMFSPDLERIIRNTTAEIVCPGIARAGQLAIMVAESGSGKTALAFYKFAPELAKEGYKVIYIDLDSAANTHKLMYDFSRRKKFLWRNPYAAQQSTRIDDIMDAMFSLVGNLSKVVIFIDTVKKVADMMQKSQLKEFAEKCKKLTAKGATIIALGHSNKHRNQDGTIDFEGTGDLKNDADAMSKVYSMKEDDGKVLRVAIYPEKERGVMDNISYTVQRPELYTMESISDENFVVRDEKFYDVRAETQPLVGTGRVRRAPKEIRDDLLSMFEEMDSAVPWSDIKEEMVEGEKKLRLFIKENSAIFKEVRREKGKLFFVLTEIGKSLRKSQIKKEEGKK